jgi:uncharacterized protein YbgA (DUF1722 family)
MFTVRTNVLLTEEDHLSLRSLAREKDKTIGELIREAIRKTYGSLATANRRKELMSQIRQLAKRANTKNIDYRVMIEEGRKY